MYVPATQEHQDLTGEEHVNCVLLARISWFLGLPCALLVQTGNFLQSRVRIRMYALAMQGQQERMVQGRVHRATLENTKQHLDLPRAQSVTQESFRKWQVLMQMCALATQGQPDRMEQNSAHHVLLALTKYRLDQIRARCVQPASFLQSLGRLRTSAPVMLEQLDPTGWEGVNHVLLAPTR